MISHPRKWIAVMYLLVIESVDPQVAMYPVFPSPVHVAVPMPVPVPYMMQNSDESSRTTTTTTERPNVVVQFPAPMPLPVPFAFPAFPNIPCNVKKKDTPRPKRPPRQRRPPAVGPGYGIPIPPPMFAPAPVVVMPYPRRRPSRRPKYSSSGASDCTDTESIEDCSSSSSYERQRKRRRKTGHTKRRPYHRRALESNEIDDNDLVKPVLTYLSRDGDVKLKRTLTKDEAVELMDDKPYQKISVVAGEDDGNMPRVLITSTNEKNPGFRSRSHRRRQVVLSPGAAQHMIGEGKKELVFKPPSGKKISNLSVSFQISE